MGLLSFKIFEHFCGLGFPGEHSSNTVQQLSCEDTRMSIQVVPRIVGFSGTGLSRDVWWDLKRRNPLRPLVQIESCIMLRRTNHTAVVGCGFNTHTHTPASLVMFLLTCQGLPPLAGLPFGEREIVTLADNSKPGMRCRENRWSPTAASQRLRCKDPWVQGPHHVELWACELHEGMSLLTRASFADRRSVEKINLSEGAVCVRLSLGASKVAVSQPRMEKLTCTSRHQSAFSRWSEAPWTHRLAKPAWRNLDTAGAGLSANYGIWRGSQLFRQLWSTVRV